MPDVLSWLCASLSGAGLLSQIRSGAHRVSELVDTVRSYSYLDQPALETLDVHDGLENTLTLLGMKLRNVDVQREYDRSLPRIHANGAQLNEVWTELLINAVRAVKGCGSITI